MIKPPVNYPRPEEGEVEVPFYALLAYIGIGLLSVALMYTLALAALSLEHRPEESGTSIAVSANVPLALSYHFIDSAVPALTIKGNTRGGFVVLGNGNKVIYSYDKMPGDGVLVHLRAGEESVIVWPKY